jgi:regulator of sirC expression with transglutaminase-like and TPR domain
MDLVTTLQLLAQDPSSPVDVAEAGLLLSGDEYPHLDVLAYVQILDQLAGEVQPYLTGDLESRVIALAQFLFEEKGYQGNSTDYYDPRNSYMSDVLDRKLGIPITLSALAMSVGCRAGLNVVGVGLPGHFIAKAIEGEDQVLFDPFHGGQILTPDGCRSLIEAVTGQMIPLTPVMFQATPPGWIVTRMLNNLKGIYHQKEDYPRLLRVIDQLRILSPHDGGLDRDKGMALLNSGQPGQALDHLTAYLQANSSAPDEDLVKQMLARARDELARWN